MQRLPNNILAKMRYRISPFIVHCKRPICNFPRFTQTQNGDKLFNFPPSYNRFDALFKLNSRLYSTGLTFPITQLLKIQTNFFYYF